MRHEPGGGGTLELRGRRTGTFGGKKGWATGVEMVLLLAEGTASAF